ncbi:GNAT family N-acetyltransferase [Propioniciclava soli]|uniref:GNAT family protein n=1 Tax=Propioniciclava soli TaxID=2775081 RepID=A0ABZ3C9I2_9ACTN
MTLFGSRRWPVTLRHGPVLLRPLRRRDEAEYHAVRALNTEWTRPWDSTRPPGSSGQGITYAEMVRSFAADARAGRSLPWAIMWAPEGERPRLAGQMSITGIVHGSARWGMAGYWVAQGLAGRGIAPTALALAADHMFEALELHRLEVAIRPENTKSIRVVEKLGLRLEGIRPAFMHVDGAWRDHAVYVLHAEEVEPEGVIGRLAGP